MAPAWGYIRVWHRISEILTKASVAAWPLKNTHGEDHNGKSQLHIRSCGNCEENGYNALTGSEDAELLYQALRQLILAYFSLARKSVEKKVTSLKELEQLSMFICSGRDQVEVY